MRTHKMQYNGGTILLGARHAAYECATSLSYTQALKAESDRKWR
jgi:hypothetical protein